MNGVNTLSVYGYDSPLNRVDGVRMGRPDRARDSINLVPAPVNSPRFVEHAVLSEDVIDGLSSAHGVALAEYLVEIARSDRASKAGNRVGN
jgi:hypothetical protein